MLQGYLKIYQEGVWQLFIHSISDTEDSFGSDSQMLGQNITWADISLNLLLLEEVMRLHDKFLTGYV